MPEVVAQQVKSDVGLASALRSSTLRLSRQIRRQREPGHDLTANQLSVLGALAKHEAMTIGELAAHEQILANRRRRDEWLQTKLKQLTSEERDILRKAAPVLERLAAR